MIAAFVTFVISIFLAVAFEVINFITKNSEKKIFVFINKFSNWILLAFSGVIIFVIYAINNFKTAYENQNMWMVNISILSYILVYSFIFACFIIILLFIPFRVMVGVNEYKNNKTLLKNNLKLFFVYGTLLIVICTLMYAFDDPIIKLDYNYDNINYFDNIMIPHLNNLRHIINSTVKSKWVPWIIIAYVAFWTIISYLLISKRSHIVKEELVIKINDKFSAIKYILPVFCYISIISTFVLSWQSFFLRCLILLLIMTIFTLINLSLKFIIKNKDNKESNNYLVHNFVNNTIISILFMFYLCISNGKTLTLSVGEHFNLWISMFVSSFTISIFSIANPSYTSNRIFACTSTAYLSSGINSFSIYFFMPVIDLFVNINTDITIKYLKLY